MMGWPNLCRKEEAHSSQFANHSSWLHVQVSRVRFPALPHFQRCSLTRTGHTQPLEDK
jgi:hypothetical protein